MQKGYAALIGLLLVILIIAILVYGGSFFSKKSQLETYIEVDKQAEKMVGDIEEVIKAKQQEIDK